MHEPMKPASTERRRGSVAFVLPGGGAHGAIQAGMLAALYEYGIAPDLITAASAGALNAAFIASRPPTRETAEELAHVWTGLRRSDVFPLNALTGALGFFGRRDSFVSARRLREVAVRSLQFERLEDSPIPLSVVTTDLITGAEHRLTTGSAADALLASAAIPGVFPPVRWGERLLIDGGIAANTPIANAIAMGARTIYVLATGYSCALHQAPRGPLAIATHALSMLIHHQVVADIARVPTYVDLIVLPPPCPLDIPPTDFSQSAELIDRARTDTLAFLPYLGKGPARVPENMRHPTHQH